MRIALDQNGIRIDAKQASKSQSYTCPICGEQVLLKATKSSSICPYFSHRANTECDSWKSDMTSWHYEWQEKFPVENREIVLSCGDIKHRADVLINDIVIEFQHSPLSEEDFQARNEFYITSGKHLIWIFDMSEKITILYPQLTANSIEKKLKLSRFKSYFKGYNPNNGYSLFFQDNNALYYITKEESKVFSFFLKPFSQDEFLKDFGCAPNHSGLSIQEYINRFIGNPIPKKNQVILPQGKPRHYSNPVSPRRHFHF